MAQANVNLQCKIGLMAKVLLAFGPAIALAISFLPPKHRNAVFNWLVDFCIDSIKIKVI